MPLVFYPETNQVYLRFWNPAKKDIAKIPVFQFISDEQLYDHVFLNSLLQNYHENTDIQPIPDDQIPLAIDVAFLKSGL